MNNPVHIATRDGELQVDVCVSPQRPLWSCSLQRAPLHDPRCIFTRSWKGPWGATLLRNRHQARALGRWERRGGFGAPHGAACWLRGLLCSLPPRRQSALPARPGSLFPGRLGNRITRGPASPGRRPHGHCIQRLGTGSAFAARPACRARLLQGAYLSGAHSPMLRLALCKTHFCFASCSQLGRASRGSPRRLQGPWVGGAGTPCRPPASCALAAPVRVPLQHLSTRRAAGPSYGSSRSRLAASPTLAEPA